MTQKKTNIFGKANKAIQILDAIFHHNLKCGENHNNDKHSVTMEKRINKRLFDYLRKIKQLIVD